MSRQPMNNAEFIKRSKNARSYEHLQPEPPWLANAHRDIDDNVAAVYGWPVGISDEDASASSAGSCTVFGDKLS